MRPRKKILLFATNEAAASRIAFVLDCKMWRVLVTHTPAQYEEALPDFKPDVVLVLFCGEGRPMAVDAARRATEGEVPVVVATMGKVAPWDGLAHAIVQERKTDGFMAELAETLRIFGSHKRGPKKEDGFNTRIIRARGIAAAQQSMGMLA